MLKSLSPTNMKSIHHASRYLLFGLMLFLVSCNSGNTQLADTASADSIATNKIAINPVNNNTSVDSAAKSKVSGVQPSAELTKVLVYYFHVKIRCVSCIAMEEATRKTLNTYFKNELNNGTIKLFVLNMDDKANNKIAEKYQAYGSGLYITRVFKGKESTEDLTTEGFKYAGEQDDKLIALIKNKVAEYLK